MGMAAGFIEPIDERVNKSSIIGEVNEPVFFFAKHILNLKHTKQ